MNERDAAHVSVQVIPGTERQFVGSGKDVEVQFLVILEPTFEGADVLKPVDETFIIDRSGSMDEPCSFGKPETKLRAVVAGINDHLDDLRDGDTLHLIAFDDGPLQVFERTRVNKQTLEEARTWLQNLHSGNGTRFTDAFKRAYEMLRPGPAVRRIYFLTDGFSNHDRPDELQDLNALVADARYPASDLTIFGTGDYNWSYLQQLSVHAGTGSYCFDVLTPQTLKDYLRGELAYLRSVAVEELNVRFDVQRGALRRHPIIKSIVRFTPKQTELDVGDGQTVRDDVGNLARLCGQRYVVTLRVPRPIPGVHAPFSIHMEGCIPQQNIGHFMFDVHGNITFVDDPSKTSRPNQEVIEALLIIAANRKVQQKDFDAAAKLYHRAGDPQTALEMKTLADAHRRGTISDKAIFQASSTLSQTAYARSTTVIPDDRVAHALRMRGGTQILAEMDDSDSTPSGQ